MTRCGEAANERDVVAGAEALDSCHHPLGFQRGGFERLRIRRLAPS